MAYRQRRGPQAEPAGTPADPPADPEAVARNICLRALTMAPKTRGQLADLLAGRNVPDDVATKVLDRFTDVGLIDDAAFANAWVQSRHNGGRGLAKRALTQELRRKGIDDDTLEQALETVDEESELRTAKSLVARKLPSMRGLAPEARTRRLVSMLARKGYGAGTAFRAVREAVLDAEHHIDDEFDELSQIVE